MIDIKMAPHSISTSKNSQLSILPLVPARLVLLKLLLVSAMYTYCGASRLARKANPNATSGFMKYGTAQERI